MTSETLHPSSREIEEELFIQFYEKHYQQFFFEAYKVLKNSTYAKDVTQKFFIKIWEERKFKEIANPKNYCSEAARNQSRDFISAEKFRQTVKEMVSLLNMEEEEENNGLPNSLCQKEHSSSPTVLAFKSACAALTFNQRRVLSLLYLDRCSYAEAASLMGMTKNSIKTLRKRAIDKLKEKLIPIINDIDVLRRIQVF